MTGWANEDHERVLKRIYNGSRLDTNVTWVTTVKPMIWPTLPPPHDTARIVLFYDDCSRIIGVGGGGRE